MSFDINDTGTWPDSPADILDALEGMGQDEEAELSADPAGGGADEQPPADEDRDGVDRSARNADLAEQPAPTQEAEADEERHGGDKLVPVKALAEVRAEVRQGRERIEALEAELAAAREAGQQVENGHGKEPPTEETDPWGQEREALVARIADVEEDDPDLAASLKQQIQQGDRLARLEQKLAAQSQQQEMSDAQQRNTAFAASPLLQAWANDAERPMWHQTAVQTHAQRMESDPAYRAMSWAERFEQLPVLVEQALGVQSPHRQSLKAPTPETKPGNEGRQGGETPDVPLSMSHIPGGVGREPEPQTAEALALRPEKEQVESLLRIANDPKKLWEFLDGLPQEAYDSQPKRHR